MPILYLSLVLGAIALAIGLVAYVTWRQRTALPQVTCSILPPYEIPDVVVVGTVLVENRGRAPAFNVRVEIRYDRGDWRQIHHIRIVSDARYVLRGGGEQYSFANLRLEKLGPGQKLLIYMAGPRPVTPEVKISVQGPVDRPARAAPAAPANSLPSPSAPGADAEPAPTTVESGPNAEAEAGEPTAHLVAAAIRSLSDAPADASGPTPGETAPALEPAALVERAES